MPQPAAANSAEQTVASHGQTLASMTVEELRSECVRLHQALHLRNCALDAATSGFVIIDMQRRGRPIVYANRALVQRTGYSFDELIGMPSATLTPVNHNQERALQIRDSMQAGEQLRPQWSNAAAWPVAESGGTSRHPSNGSAAGGCEIVHAYSW